MNKRTVGTEYEKVAENYLTARGVRIVARNFRVRAGEIDLIGYDGQTLVFFEVKYRRSAKFGSPQAAVDHRKQLQICMVSDYFCVFYHVKEQRQRRFDVIALKAAQNQGAKPEITWIRDAFPYIRRM